MFNTLLLLDLISNDFGLLGTVRKLAQNTCRSINSAFPLGWLLSKVQENRTRVSRKDISLNDQSFRLRGEAMESELEVALKLWSKNDVLEFV